MEHHLSALLVYPHHVSKWVVLVMARVMAYLTARVLVIRSFVRQAACMACWFLWRHSRWGGEHLACRGGHVQDLQSRTAPRCRLELWTFQLCLPLKGGAARGTLVLSLASNNKKKALFKWNFTVARLWMYISMCVKTQKQNDWEVQPLSEILNEKMVNRHPLLEDHYKNITAVSFHPASPPNKTGTSELTVRGKHWFQMLILHDPQCDTT